MATTIEGYVTSAKLYEESGADALELLLACPLPYLLPFSYVGGASFDEKVVEEVCLRSARCRRYARRGKAHV